MAYNGKSEKVWFLNTMVTIRVGAEDGADGMSVLEHQAPFGDSPPLHMHLREDEIFHVLSGELRCRVGGQEFHLRAGDTALAPRTVPHTYAVESEGGARWLTFTCGRDFEALVRSVSRPAERDGLPIPAGAPTPEQAAALAAACQAHGIELVGPPLAAPATAAA